LPHGYVDKERLFFVRIAIVFAMLALTLGASAAPRPALTTHVPDAVAAHSAPLAGVPAPDTRMQLAISLPLRDEAGLRALVRDIADPASASYRHYLSVAQFTARFGPSASDYAALVRFATANHLHPHALAANRRVLDVDGSVADVERALHVRIGLYRDPAQGRVFFAPDREPALDLAVPVLHISGLDNAVLPVSHLVRGAAPAGAPGLTGSGPGGNFIGSDVRAAYYGGSALTGAGQSVGLFEYAGYNLADVALYFKTVGQAENVPIVGISVNGANLNCTGKCDDSEQVLDIEETISMAPGLKQVAVYVGYNDVSILNQMASDNTSKQLSCSWGWKADPVELDPILEEFAAQGQTFLVATGDYGFRLAQGVVWPADDQLSTAVGGTDLRTNGPGGTWFSEIGWQYSGGGTTPNKIPIPSYQAPFITKQNDGSRKLRNVPDIAGDAQTDNFSCYDGGCYTGNGGTSYAAPLWAGYIALANELAAAGGKPTVGFLNPTVYAIGATANYHTVFHDQLNGYNGRYYAEPGFDLVTGFGSPRGAALINVLAGVP
jgi:subtilase family serine protease